jgi:broad specificity phosphatase PhoE
VNRAQPGSRSRRLVLVRHGQSEWNAQHRVQGQSGAGLTDLGHRQAEHTAEWVRRTHPDARLVSSDLRRCRQTVAPIAAALGTDVVEDPQVRERSFGRWEGLSLDEVQAADPDLWARWRSGEDVVAEVGGETGDQLADRVTAALTAHADARDGGTVVVVTHGGPVWYGMHALLGLPWATLGGVGNAAVTELVRGGHGWWCESWNQTAHLPVELRTSFRPSETRTAASRG